MRIGGMAETTGRGVWVDIEDAAARAAQIQRLLDGV
jgi:predicted RNA-binding protein YlxR (DUF448 family)